MPADQLSLALAEREPTIEEAAANARGRVRIPDALTFARANLREVRQATCLGHAERRALGGLDDLSRCAWYVRQAHLYEEDAAKLAAHPHLAGFAPSYAGTAGARWVAALASLLGAREPIRLAAHELPEVFS